MLLIVEDLHWSDPSTLELLTLLIDQVPTARIFALLACRLEFRPPWPLRAHLIQLTLSRLPRRHVEAIVAQVTGDKTLPSEVIQQIVTKTDGVPLFVEELTKMVLESAWFEQWECQSGGAGPVAPPGALLPLAIPATLHDSLMARLDRLALAKEVAQLGATLGRTFTYELLQAVSLWDEGTLREALRRLVEAELLYSAGAAAGNLPFQTCPHSGDRVSVAAQEQKTAIPRADCARTGGGGFRRPLRPSPSCWRITTRRQG